MILNISLNHMMGLLILHRPGISIEKYWTMVYPRPRTGVKPISVILLSRMVVGPAMRIIPTARTIKITINLPEFFITNLTFSIAYVYYYTLHLDTIVDIKYKANKKNFNENIYIPA